MFHGYLLRPPALRWQGQLPWADMFSYRHGFHAGNHADVLKHTTLIAILRHLILKDAALVVIDTHAGAGLYRLDSDLAQTSGEAQQGVLRVLTWMDSQSGDGSGIASGLLDYTTLLRGFNGGNGIKIYPGSPFIAHRILRPEKRDRLRLFELHPTDHKALAANVAQLEAGRVITVVRQDGLDSLKALLPPPNRRALVLIDPSYEIKSDYGKVVACVQDAVHRFPTGTYLVWYPIIPRQEAHDLPKRLRAIAERAGRTWLHATLNIGHPIATPSVRLPGERQAGIGLSASGVIVINPPHTLKAVLAAALPQMLTAMGRGAGKDFSLASA